MCNAYVCVCVRALVQCRSEKATVVCASMTTNNAFYHEQHPLRELLPVSQYSKGRGLNGIIAAPI